MIAIIEDDSSIRSELSTYLNNSGYETTQITDFKNAPQQIMKENADLVLLDINLPDISGMIICRELRKVSKIPIIFVTSCSTTMDEINCLMIGGDDYVSKPFQPAVLLARISSVLKRCGKQNNSPEQKYCVNGVTLDVSGAKISKDDKSSELTKNELKICCCLFSHPDIVVSRNELIDFLWDNQVYIEDNVLSVQVTRLRAKLKDIGADGFIETKRGLGYKI